MDTQTISNPRPEELDKLIKDLGLDSLSQDKQDDLIIKMTEVLLKRIFVETMDSLGEKGREEYEELTKGEVTPEQIDAFFKEKIKNYDQMVQGIVEEFKKEMMAANS